MVCAPDPFDKEFGRSQEFQEAGGKMEVSKSPTTPAR